jgi:hypothetical protein
VSYFLGIPRESYLVSLEEFEDTKVELVMNIRKLKKDRQHNGQKKKDRQHNGQKKKDKRTNNDLQNIHIKLKIE